MTVSARPRDLAAALPAQGGTVQNPPASDTAPLVEGGGDRLVQPLRAGLPSRRSSWESRLCARMMSRPRPCRRVMRWG
ncbi:hypothetical protein QWZ10_21505 [Paracoccus cavernae]|uniref:Uncharacterized protein n=1 Tax=Paracoccus cavernae TaxID=1571207 RepID=A0ABT8DBF5_9RHOB|nr:hypothetical protein [Paracoccus cavernae]